MFTTRFTLSDSVFLPQKNKESDRQYEHNLKLLSSEQF
jgi:hypothetical protein